MSNASKGVQRATLSSAAAGVGAELGAALESLCLADEVDELGSIAFSVGAETFLGQTQNRLMSHGAAVGGVAQEQAKSSYRRTKLEVVRRAGPQTVVVLDRRGPFGAGRIIDLTKDVFARIASISQGVVPVTISW